jgi:GAF domain-containing protein
MQERLRWPVARSARAASDAGTARLDALLRHDGVRGVLAALNERTRFRFTGVYRLDPPMLRNICLFDRENPTLCLAGDINTLAETYCAITGATAHPLVIADAPTDDRVVGHAARRSVQSYVGVPVRRADGSAWGTLCHFDGRPRLAPDGEVAVLERAAALLVVVLLAAERAPTTA